MSDKVGLGYSKVAILASTLCFAAAGINTILPQGVANETQSKRSASVQDIIYLLYRPGVFSVIMTQVVLGIGLTVQSSTLSLIAKDEFGLSAMQLGSIQSFLGMLSMFVNVFLINIVTQK